MRVLVVDDEITNRVILRRCLERLGHECLTAADGEQGLSVVQTTEIDVVVSNWMMPGIEGPSLCAQLRALDQDHYIYFVLLSAYTDYAHRRLGLLAGADDYLTKPIDPAAIELRMIVASRTVAMHRALTARRVELEARSQQHFDEGRRDALTGVGNRLRMQEDLAALHSRMHRYGHRYSLALFDVDYFKRYNDAAGHLAGDAALRQVAAILRQQARLGDDIYRYGGEEFLIVFPEQDLDGAAIAANRMRCAIEAAAIPHPGLEPPALLTVSVGIGCMQRDGAPGPPPRDANGRFPGLDEVMLRADRALYVAKGSGRNCVVTGRERCADDSFDYAGVGGCATETVASV